MGQGWGGWAKTYGPGWRICSECKVKLPSERFWFGSKAKDNRQNRCKDCAPTKKLIEKFGLTLEDYNSILESQNGTCLFCPATEYVSGKRLGVDHDRSCCPGNKSCGKCVRALLCQRCNTVLGLCNDNPKLLHELANFLERR